MFTSVGGKGVCQNCEKAEEEDFKKVKEFISDNGMANLDTIVKETEVPLKRITKFIREGRLEISQGLRDAFRCASCGAPIATGKFCEKCFVSMKTELTESLRPQDPNRSGKMHLGGSGRR
jgi:hypothetical protein